MVHAALTKNPTKKPTISRHIKPPAIKEIRKIRIIGEIPRSIEKRLSFFPSSKTCFLESVIYYEDCLKNSRYETKLQYQQLKGNNRNKNKRKHNIIWFNPSCGKSVKTNIGRLSSI